MSLWFVFMLKAVFFQSNHSLYGQWRPKDARVSSCDPLAGCILGNTLSVKSKVLVAGKRRDTLRVLEAVDSGLQKSMGLCESSSLAVTLQQKEIVSDERSLLTKAFILLWLTLDHSKIY